MKKPTIKYSITTLLLIIIIFIILLSSGVFKSKTSILAENSRIHNQSTSFELNHTLGLIKAMPDDIAQALEFLNLNTKKIDDLCTSLLKLNNKIQSITIAFNKDYLLDDAVHYAKNFANINGLVSITNLDSLHPDYYYNDWYLVPSLLQKPVWSELMTDQDNLLIYSKPIYKFNEGQPEFIGIIQITLPCTWLVDYLKLNERSRKSFDFVVSEYGIIIAHPNYDFIFNENLYSLALEMNLPELNDILSDIRKGISNTRILPMNLIDKSGPKDVCAISYRKLTVNDWWFVTVYDINDF